MLILQNAAAAAAIAIKTCKVHCHQRLGRGRKGHDAFGATIAALWFWVEGLWLGCGALTNARRRVCVMVKWEKGVELQGTDYIC
jgi:hypothetical protein